ncbi:hypothetical protein B1B_12177, partial [mine drainage metagenome]
MHATFMLYRDVDGKLDMTISISAEQKNPLISMINRDYQTVPLNLDAFGGHSYIDLFLGSGGGRQIESIAASYPVIRIDDVRIVRMDLEEVQVVSAVVRDLLSIDSVCPSGFYLEGNRINLDFRFHHSELRKVSDIVGKIVLLENHVQITDLGTGRGGIASINRINERVKLSVISYEVALTPSDAQGSTENFMFDAKYSTFDDKEIEAIVLYDSSEKERKFGRPISAEDGVYMSKINSDFATAVWNSCNEKHIPRG